MYIPRATWFLGVAMTAAIAGHAASAQTTRDAGARPADVAPTPSGSAVIAGTIVTDDGRPVRRAIVRLAGSDASGARTGVSDDAGRFTFTRLPAGSFTIAATKAGLVSSFYGSKRPGRGPAVPVALADGQRLAVSVTMLRGAVITGTITDAFGRPAAQITVQARAASSLLSQRPGDVAATNATTDDRGTYRLFGLAPGEYVMSAFPRAGSAGEALAVTDDEVQWARQQLATPVPPPGRAVAYSPVYFPGTTEPGTAAKITLQPGQEQSGVTFALQFVPTARIDGVVVGPSELTSAAQLLMLVPKSAGSAPRFEAMLEGGLVAFPRIPISNGRFSTVSVTPGQYTLVARTGADASGRASGPGAATLWGETDVTVNGRDLSGLVVALQPGVRVAGTVVFEGSSLAPPNDMSAVRVSLTSARNGGTALTGSPIATATPAGAFAFPSLLSGPYAIKATPPATAAGPVRWVLKSVMFAGRDITDEPFDVHAGEDVAGIVITFTDRETEISGTLLDAAGRPTSEFSIAVVTTNRAFWTVGSRRVQSVRAATNGTFRIAGLPPGEYAIVAVTDIEPGALSDPVYLEQLQAAAFTLTLADGEKKKQDLRIR